MKIALILVLLLTLPASAEAGHRRRTRQHISVVRVARLQLRTARANSGRPVAWGFYYSARTAANISGLFNPMGWLFGGLL